jgi:hypothetical protein
MEHYEVREAFRRVTSPDLTIDFYFDKMRKQQEMQFSSNYEEHAPIGLTPTISNRANTPSPYAVAIVLIDERLTILAPEYEKLGVTKLNDLRVIPYRLTFFPNKSMPIFKEQPTLMPNIGIIVPSQFLHRANDYALGFEARAPGCQNDGSCSLIVAHGRTLIMLPK